MNISYFNLIPSKSSIICPTQTIQYKVKGQVEKDIKSYFHEIIRDYG